MTRKRFVKLLMSVGYSRNSANKIAAEARSYTSYSEAMLKASITVEFCSQFIVAAIDAIKVAISELPAALIHSLN